MVRQQVGLSVVSSFTAAIPLKAASVLPPALESILVPNPPAALVSYQIFASNIKPLVVNRRVRSIAVPVEAAGVVKIKNNPAADGQILSQS